MGHKVDKGYNPLFTKQHLKAVIFKSYIIYVQENYPQIDIGQVCEEAGLPLEYLLNEENWVSITFEKAFMEGLKALIPDPQLIQKVGAFGVQAHVLGKTIHFMCFNLFTLRTLYEKLPFVTSLLNKVWRLKVSGHSGNQITYELAPIFDGLTKFEKSVLLERLPDFLESTRSYYSAIPTQKNLRPAQLEISHEIVNEVPVYTLRCQYPREVGLITGWVDYVVAFAVPLFLTFLSWKLEFTITNIVTVASAAFFFVISYLLYKRISFAKKIAAETTESLQKLDLQYQTLHATQTELTRKLAESKAMTQVVASIAGGDSKLEILTSACKALATNMSYDRSIVFLADDRGEKLKYEVAYGMNSRLTAVLENVELEIHIDSDDPSKISNVFRYGRPILIEDVAEHLHTLTDDMSRKFLQLSGATSFAAVPIKSDKGSYGVLMVDCKNSSRQLTSQDVEMLTTIATQMAIAIEKSNSKDALFRALQKTEELSLSYSRFVPFETLKQIGYDTVLDVKIGAGIEKNLTIFFSDIRDFTSLCESMSPSEVLKFLNSYFGRLSPIIKKNNGIVDKFIGDCVMAIFPEPLNAMNAAVDIQRHLVIYNLERQMGGRRPVHAGIGICQGPVIMGPIGFDGKMEITVLSDSVNTAARLDGLCKELEAKILISGVSDMEMKKMDPAIILLEHGSQSVKGKSLMIKVVELLDENLLDLFKGWNGSEEVNWYRESHVQHLTKKLASAKPTRKAG